MKIADFNWGLGRVWLWDLDRLSAERPLVEHHPWDLKEDLAAANFPGGVALDVGWYPEGCLDGRFVICVVKDGCWQKPLMKSEYSTVKGLADGLAEAIGFAIRRSAEQ